MLERQMCVKYDLKKMLGHSQQEDSQKSEKGEVIRSKKQAQLLGGPVSGRRWGVGGGTQEGTTPHFLFLKEKMLYFLEC